MKTKPIIIVAGEPNSIFFEIYFKALNYKKYKSPLILIASLKLLKLQMEKMKIKKKIRSLELSKLICWFVSFINDCFLFILRVKFSRSLKAFFFFFELSINNELIFNISSFNTFLLLSSSLIFCV